MLKSNKLEVTLTKGISHRIQKHKACVSGLGLRRIGHSVTLDDTPEIRGMIKRISYLVAVKQV